VAEDTALVVGEVAISAADSLGLFDDPVEPFGAGVGHAFGERDEDGWPPSLDGLCESGGLRHCSDCHRAVPVAACASDGAPCPASSPL
jgi:hypothetical protein